VAGESYEREIRLYDKMRALIELGKHVGLFDSKLKIDGAAIPVVIAGSDLLEDE
jgi:hypothetical protein